MRLKLYRAPDMARAMADIRAELGGDALILASRRVTGGVEVTAALEAEVPPPAPVAASATPRPHAPKANLSAGGGSAVWHHDCLRWHGVPPLLARKLGAGPLSFALSVAFRFAPLLLAEGAAPVLFAGPPGAGKTLTTARLATRLVLAGRTPLVITADGQRAGACEQLAAFTRLLGLQLLVASTPSALERALDHRKDGAPVLIDAPGGDPFDPDQLAAQRTLAGSVGAAVALVLPGGLDPLEAGEMAAAQREAGASLLIASRLDVSRRLGGVLAAAAAGLALAEAGIGPGAADGLVPMTPELLARRIQNVPNGIREVDP